MTRSSDSGSSPRLLSMSAYDQLVSAVLQRKVDGTGPGAVEVLAEEDNGGTEVENVGKGPVYTKDVGVLESEKVSRGC